MYQILMNVYCPMTDMPYSDPVIVRHSITFMSLYILTSTHTWHSRCVRFQPIGALKGYVCLGFAGRRDKREGMLPGQQGVFECRKVRLHLRKSRIYIHTHTSTCIRRMPSGKSYTVLVHARAHTHTHMPTLMQQSTKVPPGMRHEQSSPFAPPSLDAQLPIYSCIRTCIEVSIREHAQQATRPPALETQHVLYCREPEMARARESGLSRRGGEGGEGARERPVCRHGTRDSKPL